jgi:hypothetical protein
LIFLFKQDVFSVQGDLSEYSDIKRPIEMVHILFLTFIGSLYFIIDSRKKFSTNYLLTINILSIFSIILTATRSWVVTFAAAYLLTILLIPRKTTKVLLKYSVPILIIVAVMLSSSRIRRQYHNAMGRIKTVEYLMRGDITAGHSSSRFDKRAPMVMKAFKGTTILFGAGFSDYYMKHTDSHVGFQNLLLNTGIAGCLLLAFFVIQFIRYTFSLSDRLDDENPLKRSIVMFPITVMCLVLINGASQFIGYDLVTSRILVLIIMLFFSNNQIRMAEMTEADISRRKEMDVTSNERGLRGNEADPAARGRLPDQMIQ